MPKHIDIFKDKYKVRQLTQSLYPDFFFQSIHVEDLKTVKFDSLLLPFIIKPRVGFFSMGVYKVSTASEWQSTINLIRKEMQHLKGLYPISVMGNENFIIEQCINGDEYALDAYINEQGESVVLNILKHSFASAEDVSDRVYTTSTNIIQSNLKEFTEFTQNIIDLSQVKNFPLNIELRSDLNGALLPIEVNPMRFGGLCTTADMYFYAYGFNQYIYYLNQQKPDWGNILLDKGDKLFSIIVLDNSTGISGNKIKSFGFNKVIKILHMY